MPRQSLRLVSDDPSGRVSPRSGPPDVPTATRRVASSRILPPTHARQARSRATASAPSTRRCRALSTRDASAIGEVAKDPRSHHRGTSHLSAHGRERVAASTRGKLRNDDRHEPGRSKSARGRARARGRASAYASAIPPPIECPIEHDAPQRRARRAARRDRRRTRRACTSRERAGLSDNPKPRRSTAKQRAPSAGSDSSSCRNEYADATHPWSITTSTSPGSPLSSIRTRVCVTSVTKRTTMFS